MSLCAPAAEIDQIEASAPSTFTIAFVDDGGADLELERDGPAVRCGRCRSYRTGGDDRSHFQPFGSRRSCRTSAVAMSEIRRPSSNSSGIGARPKTARRLISWRSIRPRTFSSKTGPKILHMRRPVVRIVIAEIEGDKVEVDPAVVEGVAVRDHRPFERALVDGRSLAPIFAAYRMTWLPRSSSMPVTVRMRASWRRFIAISTSSGCSCDHLAVEDAMVHVADEHEVVGIVGELGRPDRICRAAHRESRPRCGRCRPC